MMPPFGVAPEELLDVLIAALQRAKAASGGAPNREEAVA